MTRLLTPDERAAVAMLGALPHRLLDRHMRLGLCRVVWKYAASPDLPITEPEARDLVTAMRVIRTAQSTEIERARQNVQRGARRSPGVGNLSTVPS